MSVETKVRCGLFFFLFTFICSHLAEIYIVRIDIACIGSIFAALLCNIVHSIQETPAVLKQS